MNVLKPSHGKHFTTVVTALVISIPFFALLVGEVIAPTTHEVKISGLAFVPQNITINIGDTIMWNNTDPVIHTLWFTYVSNGSTYLLSDPIPPDTTWSHTFNDPVNLQYYSFDKLWITGFINVTAGIHDVAVTDVVTFKTVCQQTFSPANIVYETHSVNINATVENQGDFAETFDVTAKYDGNIIQTLGASLSAHSSTIVTFTWDTTAVAHGNYTLSVEAEVVSGETDISDNTYTNGWVVVTLLGDIDGDFDIDEDDLWIFAGAWIIYYSSGVKNPLCDFDEDCDIDEDDLWAFASAWIDYYS
jgi:plastocyanin